MDHQHVVTLRQGHHLFKEIEFDTLRGRVGGETEDHHFRLGIAFADSALQLVEKVNALHQRHGANLRPGDDRAVNMDWIAGIRHQHRVAMIQGRQHQMRQPLFRADGDDGFALGIDLHLIAVLIPARNGAA